MNWFLDEPGGSVSPPSPPPRPSMEHRKLEKLTDELALLVAGEHVECPLPSVEEVEARLDFLAKHFDEYGQPKEADEEEK